MSNIKSLFSEEVIVPIVADSPFSLARFSIPRAKCPPTVFVLVSVMLSILATEDVKRDVFLFLLLCVVVGAWNLNSAFRALVLRLDFKSDTFRVKYARYQGDWKDYNRWHILVATIASALPLCYTFFEHYEVLSRPHYAIILFLFCFVVPQWLFFAGILNKEREIKSAADILARNYYYDNLKLVLPRLEYQIAASELFRYKIKNKKLFILLPKDCYTFDLISKADPRVKLVGKLPASKINRAGILERSHQHTVYRIETPSPDGKVEEPHLVLEYATPLTSMYEMSSEKVPPITLLERDHLVGSVQFLRISV